MSDNASDILCKPQNTISETIVEILKRSELLAKGEGIWGILKDNKNTSNLSLTSDRHQQYIVNNANDMGTVSYITALFCFGK